MARRIFQTVQSGIPRVNSHSLTFTSITAAVAKLLKPHAPSLPVSADNQLPISGEETISLVNYLSFSPLTFQISLSLYLGSPYSLPKGWLPLISLPLSPALFSLFWNLAHWDPIRHLSCFYFQSLPPPKSGLPPPGKKGRDDDISKKAWSVPHFPFELPPPRKPFRVSPLCMKIIFLL